MKNISTKLLAFQKEVGAIPKDSVNPFFKSKYADINTYIGVIKPILSRHGLVLLQPLTRLTTHHSIDGECVISKTALKTILIDSESGEEISDITLLPEDIDPQKMGAIITYFRRYAIQSMLCLEAEDDDGNTVSENVNTSSSTTQTVKTPIKQKSDQLDHNQLPFEGEEVCPKCSAPMAISKTKGTKYCSKLCWNKLIIHK